jgi:DinB superfamily
MDLAYISDNTNSRQRLESLLKSLSDADLARATTYGWTVSALLVHLAFWDNRVLTLIRRWKTSGIDESPIDSDAMNEAIKPICHAMDPRAAVELCRSAAAAVDAELETVAPELYAAIEASPTHFRFNRSLHRNDHLHDIRVLLGLSD